MAEAGLDPDNHPVATLGSGPAIHPVAAAVSGPAIRPVIALERIAKVYQMGEIRVAALRGVSLRVMPGELVSLMGASGSGKSTMMNILGCLDNPTAGRYLLDGVDVRRLDEDVLAKVRNRKIGFVFQSFNLIARTSALANVELPMAYAGLAVKDRRARAMAALEEVGLADRAHHFPNELSGGQQQRAAVARAIATNPSLILADEPTGNLDSHSTSEIMAIFARLHQAGRTVVLITHEPEVAKLTDRVIRLSDGQVVSDEPTTTDAPTTTIAATAPTKAITAPTALTERPATTAAGPA